MNESRDELITRIAELKAALHIMIVSRARTRRTWIDIDMAAGSTYDVDWLPEVKVAAALCDLDLSRHDPCFYDER